MESTDSAEDDALADSQETVELDQNLELLVLVRTVCDGRHGELADIRAHVRNNMPMKNCLIASRLTSSFLSRISLALGANRDAKFSTRSLKVAENSTIWNSVLVRTMRLEEQLRYQSCLGRG